MTTRKDEASFSESREWRSCVACIAALVRGLVLALCACPLLASGQTLNISDDVQTYPTLTNTVVTLSGKAELRITATGDPISGCTINSTSPDAWFFMTNIAPSSVVSTFL